MYGPDFGPKARESAGRCGPPIFFAFAISFFLRI